MWVLRLREFSVVAAVLVAAAALPASADGGDTALQGVDGPPARQRLHQWRHQR